MQGTGYWSSILRRRISRRRAIAAASGGIAGGLFLAACGSDGGDTTGEASLLSDPVDTTRSAQPGGIWSRSVNLDVQTWDVNVNSSSISISEYMPAYSMLTKYGRGLDGKNPGAEAITGDAARSWEISPDATRITLHLRDNHKFDPRPPTNGRPMDSGDIVYSWEKFAALNRFRGEIIHEIDPAGPIVSMSAPDAKTVVFDLAYPYTAITEVFAFHTYLFVLPKEAEGGFDPKSTVRGSGPFFVETIEPSIGWQFRKNPDWYEPGRPFLDGIDTKIFPEYASGLVQFEAAALWTYPVTQEDVLRVKRARPELVMLPTTTGGIPSTGFMSPSRRPGNPLLDVRVRRAASMLIDRDAWISVLYNSDDFLAAGLPVDVRWNSHMSAGFNEWVDPRTDEMGEGKAYFEHNVEEALKMLSAAGYDKSRGPAVSHFYQTNSLIYIPRNEILNGMLSEGFNTDFRVLDYQTEWREVCQRSTGKAFNGFCYNTSSGFNAENYLTSVYTPEGKFATASKPTPVLTDMVLQSRTELDPERRSEIIKDIQRRAAMEMHYLPIPGRILEFTLRWPWLRNHGVFERGGLTARDFTEVWHDEKLKS